MTSAIGELGLGWLEREETCPEKVCQGPEIAVLVADFSGFLYRLAFSVLRNRAEAEDVVQETFLRVVVQRGQLAAVREFRPWLARIAWNLALDRKRKVQPEQMDEVLAAGLLANGRPADIALADAGYVRHVLEALDRLPRAEREVLLLSAMDDLTTAEIALMLKRSESSVRSLVFRARTHLNERLERMERGKGGKR
jgi:RNA polymerase sigma-70 factor (ECF subfamily)